MSNDNLEQITEATSKGDYKSVGKLVRKASRQGNSREDIIQALSAGLSHSRQSLHHPFNNFFFHSLQLRLYAAVENGVSHFDDDSAYKFPVDT